MTATKTMPRRDEGVPLKHGVLALGRRRRARRNGVSESDALEAFARNFAPKGRVSLWLAVGFLSLLLLSAILAPVLPIAPPKALVGDLPPRQAPRFSFSEPLGTDVVGRSVTSRLIFGARQSLLIGLASASIALTGGLTIGVAAGYFRGRFGKVTSIVLDVMLSIPPLVLLLTVAAVGKRDVTTVIIGLSIVGIPTFARLARAGTLVLVDRDYVTAARLMGARHGRIIVRELVPNVLLPLSTYVFLWMAVIIVAEGSLSFLGLGVPPPNPSWGGMVNDGRALLETDPHLVFVPALCLFLTVLAFTIVGDRARRRLDGRPSTLA